VRDLPQGELAMSLRLVPLALLLSTYSALAFDTSKLGQWGSLFLDDLAPVTAKSSRLQQEINEVLSNANKKEEDVTCFGMRAAALTNGRRIRLRPRDILCRFH
jgi:hypothetical protein